MCKVTLLRTSSLVLIIAAVMNCHAAEKDTNAQRTAKIQSAVKRSLPYLTKQGEWWLQKKKCASCHRLTFLSQVLREANSRGILNEEKKMERWSKISISSTNTKNNLIGLSQLILGRDRNTTAEQKTYEEFATAIINKQTKEGSWKAEGQLPAQKRPKSETLEVVAMWHFLALRSMTQQTEASKNAQQNAMKFIRSSNIEGLSTEWHVTRLLIELHADKINKASVNHRLEQLLKLKNEDGGWGWIAGEKSDALATGQALYALSQSGSKSDNAAQEQAIDWLLAQQTKQGNWLVLGTKEKKKNKPQETSIYWGTIWATLGLLHSLPEKKTPPIQKTAT